MLVERKRLTSGTTWHAAGLITQARPTYGTREIVQRSLRIFDRSRRRPASPPGSSGPARCTWPTAPNAWRNCCGRRRPPGPTGSPPRSSTRSGRSSCSRRCTPVDLVGAVVLPGRRARQRHRHHHGPGRGRPAAGVRIVENTTVTGVTRRDGRVTGVTTEPVTSRPSTWSTAPACGAASSARWPASASRCRRSRTTTSSPRTSPVCRPACPTIKTAPDYAYVKNEAGALMVGFFEPGSYPWSSRGIPADAEFTRLPEDWDHLGPFYERMMKRLPVLAETGIRLFFSGPESFTPDGLFHLGEVPELATSSSPADSTRSGSSPAPAPVRPWPSGSSTGTRRSTSRRPTRDASSRSRPTVATSSSASSRPSTRPTRSTGRSSSATASAGIRRSRSTTGSVRPAPSSASSPGGSAPTGTPPTASREDEPAYGRPHFFDAWAAEHRAVREGVGLFDISSFGKLLVQGRDAVLLQKLSSGDVDVEPGGRLHPVAQRSRRYRGRRHRDAHRGDRVPRPHGRSDRRSRREPAAPAHRRRLRHRHGRERGTRDAVGDGAPLAGPARAADGRGPLQRRVPVPFVTAHRPRADVRPGHPDHLRRRARLGAARPVGCSRARLRHADGGGPRSRPEACGLLQPQLAAHGKGLSQLGSRHRLGGHPGRGRPRVRCRLGQARWVHRSGGVAKRRAEGPTRRLVQLAFDDPDVWAYHDEPIYRDGEMVGRIASAATDTPSGGPSGWAT